MPREKLATHPAWTAAKRKMAVQTKVSKHWAKGRSMETMVVYVMLPSGYVNIAIENGPVEIVDFPINSMVDLSIVFC